MCARTLLPTGVPGSSRQAGGDDLGTGGFVEAARLTPPGGPIFSLALDTREQDGLPNQVRAPVVPPARRLTPSSLLCHNDVWVGHFSPYGLFAAQHVAGLGMRFVARSAAPPLQPPLTPTCATLLCRFLWATTPSRWQFGCPPQRSSTPM